MFLKLMKNLSNKIRGGALLLNSTSVKKRLGGHLIGRSAINIKEIQEKPATRITFKDEGMYIKFIFAVELPVCYSSFCLSKYSDR
jgi:hypothetical protein